MRKNKYRGFDPITKKFVYGNLLFTNETYYIIPFLTNGCMSQKEMMVRWISPCYQVISETVGQFTGLHDKNGVEIYVGDIVEAWSQGTKAKGEIKQRIDGTWIMFPCWQNSEMWYLMPNDKGETTVEVIGNIHESEDK